MNNVVINVTQVVRTVEVNATPNLITITVNQSSGGSGAVSSVFGRSGSVTAQNGDYSAGQISETAERVFVSPEEKSQIPHENRSVLDLITSAFTTTLKALYDAAAEAIASHVVDTDNPHDTTASQVGAYTTAEVDNLITNVNTDATDKITVKLAESIIKGQAVYISSANGTNIIVSKASNGTEATSSKTLGLIETTGATNDIVKVVTEGLLQGLNTSSATIGDAVWLGTNGNLIFGLANKPVAPAHLVYIGVISRVHATQGEILVKVQNGFELKEIHDVAISSVANEDFLQFDASASLWKNIQITGSWLRAKLGITTLSGSNTGDQDLSGLVPNSRTINSKALSSNVTLSTSDIADSADKRYQTDNQRTFNDATSSIQGQLNNKQPLLSYTPFKFIQTSQTAHTGTTSETIVATATINGGTFNSSDVMKILYGLNKGTTTSGVQLRLKINTSNTLTGAVQIAQFNTTGTATVNIMKRNFMLNGGNLYGLSFANTTVISDEVNNGTIYSSSTYNTANTLYLFFTIQLITSGDSVTPNLFNLTN